jgi:hypothetical protein
MVRRLTARGLKLSEATVCVNVEAANIAVRFDPDWHSDHQPKLADRKNAALAEIGVNQQIRATDSASTSRMFLGLFTFSHLTSELLPALVLDQLGQQIPRVNRDTLYLYAKVASGMCSSGGAVYGSTTTST